LDPQQATFWTGVALVIGTFAWITYVSLVLDALHKYAVSSLMESLDNESEALRQKFEELTRNDENYIQAAEISRLSGFVLHYLGWMAILMPGSAFDGNITIGHVSEAVLIAAVLCLGFLVLCVLIVPPMLIRQREEAAVKVMLPGFAKVAMLFYPAIWLSNLLTRFGARIEGVQAEETPQETFEEDLADSLEEAGREGVLDEDEREMIHNVVELGQTQASKAMIPRTDMISAEIQDEIDAVLKMAVENGHSRVPVYEGDRDHVVGVFYTRDLVPSWGDKDVQDKLTLREIIRPAHFWPETKPLDDLLREMRQDRLKIAILKDEHGGTAGMITLEDILEEIVGDIHDEYDGGEYERAHRAILPFVEQEAEADGDVDVDEVNRALEIDIPEDDEYNSLGGYIVHSLGRLAKVGDEIEADSVRMTVIEATERRISRVKLTRLDDRTETEVKR
jgi:putative hemolysin